MINLIEQQIDKQPLLQNVYKLKDFFLNHLNQKQYLFHQEEPHFLQSKTLLDLSKISHFGLRVAASAEYHQEKLNCHLLLQRQLLRLFVRYSNDQALINADQNLINIRNINKMIEISFVKYPMFLKLNIYVMLSKQQKSSKN
ncbi:unnamed protein product (macronuclear) [Paramecium tetraurelia]|uniref:Uncharacterized protein n=1 Tax=Paramecium tetraurelia TaxID=5888 RepID=A0BSQ6_PARTE|nr:uncharacterized protein GSPATT00031805001 [Paramecium tetraurelia]CAK61573.1 unnamed protein product [Paramecium tetraurelia]|eukprot:XP_001428971.1 hypothetical protein (macronuclear) [Paramecium tetraurelia strain d4-2]